jgi:hypothetical protein
MVALGRKQRRSRNMAVREAGGQSGLEIASSDIPGKIEGGNIEPVIVSGTSRVTPALNIPRNLTVRSITMKESTDEAIILCDNPVCFPYTKQVPYAAQTQSFVYYMNGENLIDVTYSSTPYFQLLNPNFPPDSIWPQYKFNDACWVPQTKSAVIINDTFDDVETHNTINDFCLLVGEARYQQLPDQIPRFHGGFYQYATQMNLTEQVFQIGIFFPYYRANQGSFQQQQDDQPIPPVQKIQNFNLIVEDVDGSQSDNFPDNVTFFAICANPKPSPPSPTMENYVRNQFVVVGCYEEDIDGGSKRTKKPIAYLLESQLDYFINAALPSWGGGGGGGSGGAVPDSSLSFKAIRIPIPTHDQYSEILFDCSINALTSQCIIVGQALDDNYLHPMYSVDIDIDTREGVVPTWKIDDISTTIRAVPDERLEAECAFIQTNKKLSVIFPSADRLSLHAPLDVCDTLRSGQHMILDMSQFKSNDTRQYGNTHTGFMTIRYITDDEIVVNERMGTNKPCLIPWGFPQEGPTQAATFLSTDNQLTVIVPTRAEGIAGTFFPDTPNYIIMEGPSNYEIMHYENAVEVAVPDYPGSAPAAPLPNVRAYLLTGITRGYMGTSASNISLYDNASAFATVVQRIIFADISSTSRLSSTDWEPNMATAMVTGENGILKKFKRFSNRILDVDLVRNITSVMDIGPVKWRSDGQYCLIGVSEELNISLIKYGQVSRVISVPSYAAISSIGIHRKNYNAMLGSVGIYEFSEYLFTENLKDKYLCSTSRNVMSNQRLHRHPAGSGSTRFAEYVWSGPISIGDLYYDSITIFVETWIDYPGAGGIGIADIQHDVLMPIYLIPDSPHIFEEQVALPMQTYVLDGIVARREGFYIGEINHLGTPTSLGEPPENECSYWLRPDNHEIFYCKKAYTLPVGDRTNTSTQEGYGQPYGRYLFIGAANQIEDNATDYDTYITVTIQGMKPPHS